MGYHSGDVKAFGSLSLEAGLGGRDLGTIHSRSQWDPSGSVFMKRRARPGQEIFKGSGRGESDRVEENGVAVGARALEPGVEEFPKREFGRWEWVGMGMAK